MTEQQLQWLYSSTTTVRAPSTCSSSPRSWRGCRLPGAPQRADRTAQACSPTSTSTATARSASPSCAPSSRSLTPLTEGQLALCVREFDADGDGFIGDGILLADGEAAGAGGATANPQNISKDLQLTVRELEQLISTNEARAQPRSAHSLTPTSARSRRRRRRRRVRGAGALRQAEKGAVAPSAPPRKSLGDRSAGGDLPSAGDRRRGDAKNHHSRAAGHGHHRSHGKGGKSRTRAQWAQARRPRAARGWRHRVDARPRARRRRQRQRARKTRSRRTTTSTSARRPPSSASASRSSVRAGGSAAESPDLWA